MRQILVMFFVLNSCFGLAQSSGIDSAIISKLISTAKIVGLDDNPYKAKYRIWNNYYVLELISESGINYSGSINFYLYWNPKMESKKNIEEFISRNIPISSADAYLLHNILIDSMKIDKKMANLEDNIYLDFSCFSYIEYFDGMNTPIIRYCPSSELGKDQDSHKYFSHFINRIVSVEQETNDLIKKIKVNYPYSFYSLTTCCCGNEYFP